MKQWEEVADDRTGMYHLVCPLCSYKYSPNSAPDGTISPTEIHKFCPKCGETLDDPAKDIRY